MVHKYTLTVTYLTVRVASVHKWDCLLMVHTYTLTVTYLTGVAPVCLLMVHKYTLTVTYLTVRVPAVRNGTVY